ncbi:MAG TPA: ABC transporter substrate-binding protein [Conexibacter sp.]|nr:ABC transporter substrate-binding protein [Conexibacter sp.]
MTGRIARIVGALLALAACVALAACGGGSSSSETSGGGSSTGASGGGDGYGSAGGSGGDDSGRVTVGAVAGIPQLDPYRLVSATEASLMHVLWSSLVKYDESGELVGELAESWEATDGNRVFTFRLAPDATFADGKPIDADVVVANLRRAIDPRTAWVFGSYIPRVRSIEAVDRATVRITLARPSSTLLGALTLAMIADPENLRAINDRPNASGPFELARFTPNETVELSRRADFWGEPAAVETLAFVRARDATAAVSALRTGDLDALFQVPWTDVASLEGEGISVAVSERPGDAAIIMGDNTSRPFDDPRARQALSLATDREAIVETAYAGKTEAAAANVPISGTSPWFDRSLPAARFDLDEAKRLFDEVGVRSLTWWAPSEGYPEFAAMGEILRSDLRRIGIELKIESVETNTWLARFAPAGKSWPNTLIPTVYVAPHDPGIFLSQWFPGICECNFDDPRYVAAVEAGVAAPDETAAKRAYDEAQQIFATQNPVSVVSMLSFPVATREGVSGIFLDETGYGRFEQATVDG